MGKYRNEDEALIGLARQLTDAYGEARTRDDQDYACDEIAAFLAAQRLDAPSEALIAILDLPLTAETYPLVDEAQSTLARRGPAVVEALLVAALGDVYDPDGPAPERAAETLDLMDRREAAQGLTEVLCGKGDDELKGAAVDALVALGAFAEPGLVVTLDDPKGRDWAQAALEQIRFERDHPGIGVADDEEPAIDDYGFSNSDEVGDYVDEDDAGADSFEEDDGQDDSEDAGREPREDEAPAEEIVKGAADAGVLADADAAAGPADAAGPVSGVAGPDQDLVDDAYERFLREFEQGAGEGAAEDGDASGEAPETPSAS